jgi:tRNA pseudouridine55 synthase
MILFVDKPMWWTSHDVVKYVKIHGWYKKVWHAGTLDPLATGLLIVLTDEDTKQMSNLVGHDKSYEATIDLSHTSDTRDTDYYERYEEVSVATPPSVEEIDGALQSMTPKAIMPVPSFSAKKQWGRRSYKDAYKWVMRETEQEMDIYSIELISYAFPLVSVRCHVGSGTYIRSIAYALWQKLWTWGIITALRRTTIWSYDIAKVWVQDLADIKQKT